MKFKDILAIVTRGADNHVVDFAEQLAEQNSGTVTTMVVGWLPSVPLAVEGWTVNPLYGDLVREAEDELKKETVRVRKRVTQNGTRGEVESDLLEVGAARPVTGMRARHADLTVVGRADLDAGDALVEGPLFESGRPVIVVPPEWKPRRIGKTVLVCWKPTREAARAFADADDFLAGAERVFVVTVDAKPSDDGYGPHPGADITAHLARRGLKAELINLSSMGKGEAQAIQNQALTVDADLIVMGGYGRSRMSEFIFGGVTREMLTSSKAPMLLAH